MSRPFLPHSLTLDGRRNNRALSGVMVFLLTLVVYLPTLQNGFTNWDDDIYVYANPYIQRPLRDVVRWAFATFYAGNWHPLTWISHAIDYRLWGLNPMGHHLTNNIVHASNAMLVMFICFRILDYAAARNAGGADSGTVITERDIVIAGVFAGLLFGVHPLHVESVAWISERKDLLCGMFFCLSLLAYLDYAGDKERVDRFGGCFRRNYLLSLGFFVCALLSKPMAVTLPVVLLILDWYPLERIRSSHTLASAVGEKIPFIALSAASSVMTVIAENTGRHIVSLDVTPLSVRIPVAFGALLSYLEKMILPMNLNPFYPYPQDVSPLSVKYLLPVVAVSAITVSAILLRGRRLWPAVWAYYLITLLPVLGIVRVGMQAMADRYTYLPSIGPFFVLGLAAAHLCRKGGAPGQRIPGRPRLGVIAAVFVLTVFSALTIIQIGVWRNSVTLWDYVIEREPRPVAFAYNNRGVARNGEGVYDLALHDFNMAVAVKPRYPMAYYNRGLAYSGKGMYPEAIRDFTKAIVLKPDYYQAYNDRGLAYDRRGMHDEAIEDFTKAIALKPDYGEAFNNRGISFGEKGVLKNAEQDFVRATVINPDYFEAFCNLGRTFMLNGKYEQAVKAYTGALALEPENAGVFVSRGRANMKAGKTASAVTDLRKGCALGSQTACGELKKIAGE